MVIKGLWYKVRLTKKKHRVFGNTFIMLQLRFTNNSKPPMWLVAPKYVFGSQYDCDCVLTQPGVEQAHAQITVEGEVVALERTAKAGHLKVNGMTIGARCQLKPGDQIEMGEALLRVVDPKLEGLAGNSSASLDKTEIRQKSSSPKQPLWQLRPLNTKLGDKNIPLLGSTLLGRAKDCNICIPASHLSRKHAKFIVMGESLTVEDLKSSNGTFVNGKRIGRIVLKHGDEVSFDTLKFRVESSTKENEADVTKLRSALEETQIRQAVSLEHIHKKTASSLSRKAPPIRPTTINTTVSDEEKSEEGDGIKLLAGAALVVGTVGFLVWFLLV